MIDNQSPNLYHHTTKDLLLNKEFLKLSLQEEKEKKLFMSMIVLEEIEEIFDNENSLFKKQEIHSVIEHILKQFNMFLFKLDIDYFCFTKNIEDIELFYMSIQNLYKVRVITCYKQYNNLSEILSIMRRVNKYNINTTNKRIIDYKNFSNIEKKLENENVIYNKMINSDFIVYKQGITNTKREIVKYECLVRMKTKQNEILTPFSFLSVARRYNLYSKLTREVIEHSFNYFNDKDIAFSINFENSDLLDKDIMYHLERKLLEYLKNKFTIEFTETDSLSEESISILNFLRKTYKVKISIDDFGVQNSNLYNVLKLKPDFIKIDGEFIKGDNFKKEDNQKIIKSIVLLAKSFNAETIAEFVSNESFNTLKNLGVNYFQGYDLHIPEYIKN